MDPVSDPALAVRQRREAAARERISEGANPLRPIDRRPRAWVEQGIYTVQWDTPDIQLDFDLLHTHRDGETSAELSVICEGPDASGPTVLHRTRLNLLSTVAQERLAKYLVPRTKHLDNIDWAGMLASACQQVLALYRQGEPAVYLRDTVEPEGGELMPPLLADDGPTIIFGDAASGKSLLALAVGISLQTGQSLVEGFHPARTLRTAYLDWEWEAHVHRKRMRLLWPNETLPEVLYIGCRSPLTEERDRLRHLIREHQLEFLIFDSVGLACGGEPESAEIALGFFNAVRSLGLPSLLIAHIPKADAKNGSDRPFGSTYWHASARKTWYIRRAEGSGPDSLAVGLFNKKSSSSGFSNPIGLTMRFADDLILIQRSDIREQPDLDSKRPMRARITDELRGGPRKVHELAEVLDLHSEAVRTTLKRGEGRAFVRHTGSDGIEEWVLAALQ